MVRWRGRSTELSEVQLQNAFFPMVSRLAGSFTVLTASHPSNALSEICTIFHSFPETVTVSGIAKS